MIFQKFFSNPDFWMNFQMFFLIFFPLIIYFLSLFFKKDWFLKIFAPGSLIFVLMIYFVDINYQYQAGSKLWGLDQEVLRIQFFKIDYLDFKFAFNFFGVSFLFFSYILCFLTIIYSISYCKLVSISFSKLIRLIFLAIFSVNLIALSSNLFVSFVGYELLSIVTYFLIILPNKDTNIMYVGREYLNLLLIFSSIFFFLVLIFTFFAFDGNMNFDFFGISAEIKEGISQEALNFKYFLYSFIILLIPLAALKAAIFPFHFWLPQAMAAHLPVSAVLHAALVVKSGILVIFQVLFFKIGLHNFHEIAFSKGLSFDFIQIPKILSGLGVIFLSFMATRKSEMKRILAYSTAAQLNYILLSFFNIACDIKDFPEESNFSNLKNIQIFVLIQIFVHAFSKISLFFCVGYFFEKYKIKYKTDYKGLFAKEKLVSIVFALSCFSLLGFPFLPGSYNKKNLINIVIDSGSIFSLVCIFFGFLFSLYYFLPILYDMFFSRSDFKEEQNQNSFWSMKFSIFFSIVCLFLLTLLIFFIQSLLGF
jgi:multicomponent Na+:H+ antiporter subunit D